jgi:hypothetical protein
LRTSSLPRAASLPPTTDRVRAHEPRTTRLRRRLDRADGDAGAGTAPRSPTHAPAAEKNIGVPADFSAQRRALVLFSTIPVPANSHDSGMLLSTFSRVLEQNLPLFAAAVFLAFGGLTGAVFFGGQAASLQVELLLCDSEVQLSSPCSVKVKQVGGLAAVRRKRAGQDLFFFGHFLKGNDF